MSANTMKIFYPSRLIYDISLYHSDIFAKCVRSCFNHSLSRRFVVFDLNVIQNADLANTDQQHTPLSHEL